jgi:hypothetical protein
MQAALTSTFLLEAVLKAAMLPWSEYKQQGRNQFDAAIAIATCACSVVVCLPNGVNDPAIVRATLSLRLLRLLRLLRRVPTFRTVMTTFIALLPAAGQLLSTLLLIMFVFATVGLHLFGGAITTDASGVLISRERAAALAASRGWRGKLTLGQCQFRFHW